MPAGLAAEVYGMIHGQFTEDERKGVFKPEVTVGADASAQERLLAYTGRDTVGLTRPSTRDGDPDPGGR